MVLNIPAPVRAQVLADAGRRLLATGSEITTKGLTGAIQESANTIGGNAVDIYVSGKDKGLLDDAGRSALVGGVLNSVPSGSKGTRVQAASTRPGLDNAAGIAQQSPLDAGNPVQDTLAGAVGRGSGRADDLPVPIVQAQPVTPVAPVVQPGGAAWGSGIDVAQAVDFPILMVGAQALPGSHLDASLAPAVPGAKAGPVTQRAEAAGTQQILATAADPHEQNLQGASALDLPADVPATAPAVAMELTDEGTLSVEGDPRALEAFLNNAGVDKVFLFGRSLLVAPEQAAQAQQALAALSPDAANALKRQPPPVQMTMRESGMLNVEGDTKAVRQWLEDAGIPGGAMTDGPEGVIVTAGSVERARQALAGPGASLASTEQLPIAQSRQSRRASGAAAGWAIWPWWARTGSAPGGHRYVEHRRQHGGRAGRGPTDDDNRSEQQPSPRSAEAATGADVDARRWPVGREGRHTGLARVACRVGHPSAFRQEDQ